MIQGSNAEERTVELDILLILRDKSLFLNEINEIMIISMKEKNHTKRNKFIYFSFWKNWFEDT